MNSEVGISDEATTELSDRRMTEAADLPQASPQFEVTDAHSANWLVRRIVEARGYAERVQEWAAAELRRAKREEAFLLARYGHQAEQWLREELRKARGRRRSMSLPAGTMGLRSVPPRLEVVDQRQALEWCCANLPGAVMMKIEVAGSAAIQLREWAQIHCPDGRVTEGVSKLHLKDHATTTGELPDGVRLIDSPDFFYIK